MRAVAQEEDPKSASPEDKAIALQCTVVEKYNRYSLEDRDNDARLGVYILRFGSSIGFILTIIMSPLLMGLLFTIINKVFSSNSEPGTESKNSNKSGTDNHMDSYKPIFVAGLLVSFVYSTSSISIGLYQATKTSRLPLNEFEYMKICFLVILVVWLTSIAVILTLYNMYKNSNTCTCIKEVIGFFCALSLAVFTADVMLSFAPTFLFLFPYPISSALLVLHIAIFYCTIILVAVYFAILHKWIIDHYKVVSEIVKIVEKITTCKRDNQTKEAVVINLGWFVCITIGLILIALLHICILFFYQFVITRSNTTNVSSSGISLYIPSLVIAVFGFLVKKGAFERRMIKEKKAKRMLLEQAKATWTVFGNRLLEGEGNSNDVPLGQTKIKDLAQKLAALHPPKKRLLRAHSYS